jgi:uncharacterized protein YggE
MKVKLFSFSLLAALFLMPQNAQAQASGNVNYKGNANYNGNNNYNPSAFLPETNINTALPSQHLQLSVKAMANITADSYVAVFALSQNGKTTEETNTLLDERIGKITKALASRANVTIFIDMVSFVPTYEFELEKKTFSRSYNELPKGFELKKNIHIKFTDVNMLNLILTVCAEAEVYDLVRVDYFSTKMEAVKKELADKAKVKMKQKMAFAQDLLGQNLDSLHKHFADSYRVFYPMEMYKSYTVSNSATLDAKGKTAVNRVDKNVTLYYQPIFDKEFDIVLQPEILEPAIQILYELRIQVDTDAPAKEKKPTKEFILVTPNGDLKPIKLD